MLLKTEVIIQTLTTIVCKWTLCTNLPFDAEHLTQLWHYYPATFVIGSDAKKCANIRHILILLRQHDFVTVTSDHNDLWCKQVLYLKLQCWTSATVWANCDLKIWHVVQLIVISQTTFSFSARHAFKIHEGCYEHIFYTCIFTLVI